MRRGKVWYRTENLIRELGGIRKEILNLFREHQKGKSRRA